MPELAVMRDIDGCRKITRRLNGMIGGLDDECIQPARPAVLLVPGPDRLKYRNQKTKSGSYFTAAIQ
jgi:hypothetical protein